MRTIALVAALAFMPALASAYAADAAKPVPPAMMWDLSDLYASPEAWTAAHDKVLAEANKLDGYKGTLGKSAADMLTALNAISAVHKEVDRLGGYASLKRDEDVRVAENQERQQLAQALYATLGEKTSWLTPEILAIGADKVKSFEAQSAELKRLFGFTLDNILRPWLIRMGADLPLLLIFGGVIGGLLAFGLVGIFIGPVVLAVAYTLLEAWLADGEEPPPA